MSEPTDAPPAAPATCCGQVPASTKGGPIALVCTLCRHPAAVGVYWRNDPQTAARLAAVEERFAATGSWLPDLPEPRRRA